VEKTTPIIVSVASRASASECPHEQGAKEQRRRGTDKWVDVERERYPDPGQGDVRQRVGGERHAPHDHEAAHEAGGNRHSDGQGERFSGHAAGNPAVTRTPQQADHGQDGSRRTDGCPLPTEAQHLAGVLVDHRKLA
jgi:hypothetical protein